MKITFKKYVPIFYVMSALIILLAPYAGDSTLGTDGMRKILKFLLYFFAIFNLVIVLISFFTKKKITLSQIMFLLSFAVYFIINSFHIYDYSMQIQKILTLLLCIGFGLADDESQLEAFTLFRKIWIIISTISVICYLSYMFKLPIPYTEVSYYNHSAVQSYISYGLVYIYKVGASLRLCGICNEPGYFGTVTAFVLCADRLNLKKLSNIIMLIAGLCSFSLAYVLIIFIYLIIKSFKNIKILSFLLVLIGIYIFILPNIQFENKNINLLIDRLSFIYDGSIKTARGNSVLEDAFKEAVDKHPIFGFGEYYTSTLELNGSANYKINVVNWGIGGCLLIWGSLLLSALFKRKISINSIAFLVAFLASIYQRSGIMTIVYILLLIGGIQFIANNDKEAEKESKKIQEAKLSN